MRATPSPVKATPRTSVNAPILLRPYRIVEYTSVNPLAPDDMRLIQLIEQCERNTARGLTGYLHFDKGRFHQVIEGPDVCVDRLLNLIRRDARHCDMTVLDDHISSRRAYDTFETAYVPDVRPELPTAKMAMAAKA